MGLYKPRKSSTSSSVSNSSSSGSGIVVGTMNPNLCTTLFFVVIFTIPTLFLLKNRPSSLAICSPLRSSSSSSSSSSYSSSSSTSSSSYYSWSGDLQRATFAWNKLSLPDTRPTGNRVLKVAVFSRKWPTSSVPGGMERHAYTLHTALARRGHKVHVFTSPFPKGYPNPNATAADRQPIIHCHEDALPGQWRYNKAWDLFVEENKRQPFDVVHSESVALPHWLARLLPNLVVSWHGIALESLHSSIYQDLALRDPSSEPMSPGFNDSIRSFVPKVLDEIRFFQKYAHHVAISDSCGEMLRDIYQIPTTRVHVILNGVDDQGFTSDPRLGQDFRSKIGLPKNATLVLGVAGRLVRDKGHPLLYEAFSRFSKRHPTAYLIVAGSGPWAGRYRDLGPQVLSLGSMNPAQLKEFYNAVDVFVNPTLRPQGLDLTLMEAMMSGKPVMASRFPSIKGTIVVEEEYGFLFAPNVDSLEEAMEDAAKEGKERLAERGRACGEYAHVMFTAHKMALAYERLFLCVKNQTFCTYP